MGSVMLNAEALSEAVINGSRKRLPEDPGGGAEKRVGPIALRGDARFSKNLWHPAAGIGLNLTRGFDTDVATFDTTANIQEERRAAFAASLRFSRQPKDN